MKKKLLVASIAITIAFLIITQAVISIETEGNENELTDREKHLKKLESLPYFLEGTLLDGNIKVIETEEGKLPEYIDEGKCDKVLSTAERMQIVEQARKAFIEKYGIDPYPPEEEIITAPTKEELENINLEDYQDINHIDSIELRDDTKASKSYPHENGYCDMWVAFFPAYDSSQSPYDPNSLITKARYGWNRFGTFGIDTFYTIYWGWWDCSDAGTNSYDQLPDFEQDYASWGLNHPDYVVNMGLNRIANHNGIARTGGFHCIVTEDCTGWIEHEKSIVSQHELTHCIGHIHDDSCMWPSCHSGGTCVVNYWCMWWGTTTWCNSCSNQIDYYIWNW